MDFEILCALCDYVVCLFTFYSYTVSAKKQSMHDCGVKLSNNEITKWQNAQHTPLRKT